MSDAKRADGFGEEVTDMPKDQGKGMPLPAMEATEGAEKSAMPSGSMGKKEPRPASGPGAMPGGTMRSPASPAPDGHARGRAAGKQKGGSR